MNKKRTISRIMVLALVLGQVTMASPDAMAKSKKIRLNKKTATITVGKTVKLKLRNTKKKAVWKSSNKKIATVSKKGIVKAKKAGSVTITAKVNKKKYTCRVTVKKKPKKTKSKTAALKTTQVPKTGQVAKGTATPRPTLSTKPTQPATETPKPTVVPTPDVKKVTIEQITEWNKDNEAFDVVHHEDGEVSFISGQVYNKPVTSEKEAYQAVAALKGVEKSEDIDVCFLQKDTDSNGDIYYRFNQIVSGYLLPNCGVVLATDAKGNTISYSSSLYSDVKDLEVPKMIEADDAVEAVKAIDPSFIKDNLTEPYIENANAGDGARLVWAVIGKNPAYLEDENEYPYVKYAIDAYTGQYLFYTGIPYVGNLTTEEAMGNSNVFRSVKTQEMEFTDASGEKVKLPVAKYDDTHYYVVDTKRKIMTYDYVDEEEGGLHRYLKLFEKPEELSPNFVSVIHNIMKIYDYYGEMGYKSTDGKGRNSISLYLGYRSNGEEIDNAAFFTSIGNESRFVFADYKSEATLDTAAHEYGHSIQANFAKGIEYSGISGAIMESYADIVGNLLEMNVLDDSQCDKDKWSIGESGPSREGACRIMGDPHAVDQPEYVGDMFWVSNRYPSSLWNDNSGVHTNSAVLNYICYSLFKNKKQNFKYADYLKIWFNTAYVTMNTTDYKDYQAYVKYSMRRSRNSNDLNAVDEVFNEANISKTNETEWDYDRKEGCEYIQLDASECKENEFLAANVQWTDAEGKAHTVYASSQGDNLIAMVPANTDYTILYGLISKEDPELDYMAEQRNVTVKESTVTDMFKRDEVMPSYRYDAAWAYRPSAREMDEETYADVFFLNPTAVQGSKTELNMDVYDVDARQEFLSAVDREKEIYNKTIQTEEDLGGTYTHFYAPYYRQQTEEGVQQTGEAKEKCKTVALNDVKRAFQKFMNLHKAGTPIILAGFSQGSELIKELLTIYRDDKDFMDDYVASYAIGWNFSDEFLQENPNIKMAQAEDDLGVVVSFCSEAEDYDGDSIIVPKDTHINGINPLNWKTDSTAADKSLNEGACFVNRDGSIKKETKNLCGAYLDETRGTLKVTGVTASDYPPVTDGLEEGNFHDYDYQFFYRNLQHNVLTRIFKARGEDIPEEEKISYADGVTKAMAKPEFWTNLSEQPNKVLLDQKSIADKNQEILETSGTGMYDLENMTETYDGTALQKSLAKSIDSDANRSKYYANGEAVDKQTYFEEIKNNILNNTSVTEQDTVKYAVGTKRTEVKWCPTTDYIGYSATDTDNEGVNSAININEPMVLKAQTADGKFYWGYTANCTGWVAAEDVAICQTKEEWLDAWQVDGTKKNFLVVTTDKIVTETSFYNPEISAKTLTLGTRLKLARKDKVASTIDGRGDWHNYVVYLPTRTADGQYEKKLALISEHNKVNVGYLPFTEKNILELAYECLGNRYGWGGSLDALDCSLYVCRIYSCFGLSLPRNTTWQQKIPGCTDISAKTEEEKAALIEKAHLGSVLYFQGHEMIYLGSYQGRIYVISALGSLVDVGDAAKRNVFSVAINTLDAKRANGKTWLACLTGINTLE